MRSAAKALALCSQPLVQRGEVRKPRARREQPLADVADLVLHLPLLPAGGRRAGDRLEQVVVGERQEPAVEASLLAREDHRDERFGVVVDHPPRHATEEGEGAVMGIEHHLLRLPRVGREEALTAGGAAKVRQLDALHHPAELDLLMAPVELCRVARWEHQRNEGLRAGAAPARVLPGFHSALHAVVGPCVAGRLQILEQPPGGAPLTLRALGVLFEPALEPLRVGPQLWLGLHAPVVDRHIALLQILLERVAREVQLTRKHADLLSVDQVAATDLGSSLHG